MIEFLFTESNGNVDFSPIKGMQDLQWQEEGRKGIMKVESITAQLPQFLDIVNRGSYVLASLECRKLTLDDLFISMTGRSLEEEDETTTG